MWILAGRLETVVKQNAANRITFCKVAVTIAAAAA
jgi:hypothetical protein